MSRFFLTLHQSRPRKQGHVQFWPLADIPAVAIDVRFQGKSGHNFHQLARQLMTQSGHCDLWIRSHLFLPEARRAPAGGATDAGTLTFEISLLGAIFVLTIPTHIAHASDDIQQINLGPYAFYVPKDLMLDQTTVVASRLPNIRFNKLR